MTQFILSDMWCYAIVFLALCIQFVPYSSEFSSLLPRIKLITPTTANTNVLTHNLEATGNTSTQKINTRSQLEAPMPQPDTAD
jgi:hypothetical protein